MQKEDSFTVMAPADRNSILIEFIQNAVNIDFLICTATNGIHLIFLIVQTHRYTAN